MKKSSLLLLFGIISMAVSCSSGGGNDEPTKVNPVNPNPPSAKKIEIKIGTTLTRATETAFENGDQGGLFIVNHNSDGSAVSLQPTGNYVDNMRYSYTGTWNPATTTYWKDETTHADFYFYYPYTSSINSVTAMPFSVAADQSSETSHKTGDLIIGSTLNVAPTSSAVQITTKHVMSLLQVKLVAGPGLTTEQLATATVRINGVKTNSTVDLSSAVVTATGDASTITPLKTSDGYEAFIVPQNVAESNIITVTVDGRDYNLRKAFDFQTGKKYPCTVTLNRTSNGINVSITAWEDDGIDYGGTAE